MVIRPPRDEEEVLRIADTAEAAFGPREPGWWRAGFRALWEHAGPGMFLAGEVDGDFASALICIATEVWLHDRLTPLGAVAAVSTKPAYRKRGYAGELMKEIVRKMRREGTVLSVLNPFSYAYYRKFGYEFVGPHLVHRFEPGKPEALASPEGVSELDLADLPAVSAVSDTFARRYTLTSRWSPERLRVMGAFASASPFAPRDKATADLLVCREGGAVTGFALVSRPEGEEALSRIVLHGATTPTARPKLLAAAHARGARTIELHCPSDDPFLRSVREQRDVTTSCGLHYQFRVIDPAKALSLLTPAEGARGALRLLVADPVFPEAPLEVTVEMAGGVAEARDGGGDGLPTLRMSIMALSQLYANAIRPSRAAAEGLITGDAAALPLAEALFPHWTAYRSPVEPG